MPELQALCGDLTTATNINRALAQVFLLMAQGRIAQKQAVAFGYLSQLLLQTVPGIRSEFVSAFGYHPWEERLKRSLTPNQNEDPGPRDRGGETPEQFTDDVAEPVPSSPATSLRERATSPDYADLYSRSLNLLDGKYDTTPEGRREANALVNELELMNPPPSKPPRDFRGRAIELVRRLRAHKVTMRPASSSRANNVSEGSLLSPRRLTKCSASESPLISPSSPPTVPGPSSEPSTMRAPIPQSGDVPPSPNPGSNCATPTVAHAAIPEAPPRVTVTNKPPSPTPSPAAPVPGITLTREGHTHDWYVPASWSKPSRPDPFPSRKEKLERKLRSMRHLNSRGF